MKTNLSILSLFAALLVNGSSVLAANTTTVPHFEVACASGIQLCEPPFSVSIKTTKPLQAVQLKYDILADRHCSPIRLHIFVDGKLVKTTGFLGWTSSEPPFDTLPLTADLPLPLVKPGIHVVSINAEGRNGGCNSGQLSAWGGSLQLTVLPQP